MLLLLNPTSISLSFLWCLTCVYPEQRFSTAVLVCHEWSTGSFGEDHLFVGPLGGGGVRLLPAAHCALLTVKNKTMQCIDHFSPLSVCCEMKKLKIADLNSNLLGAGPV